MAEDDLYPEYPLEFVCGDDVQFEVLVEDPDPDWVDPDPDADPPNTPDMLPRNLTGWTARAQVRSSSRKDAELQGTFTLTGFGTDGMIYVLLPHAESMNCRRPGGWDLELSDPTGFVTTILGGPTEPTGDYTQ